MLEAEGRMGQMASLPFPLPGLSNPLLVWQTAPLPVDEESGTVSA